MGLSIGLLAGFENAGRGVDDIGLDRIEEHRRSSPPMATVHRTVAFRWVRFPEWNEGKRKGGFAVQSKKVSGGHFFSPWESPSEPDGSPQDCWLVSRMQAEAWTI